MWTLVFLVVATPILQGTADNAELDPYLGITAAVNDGFLHSTEADKQAAVQRLWKLWTTMPKGELADKALQKIKAFCSMSTTGFPDDNPFRELSAEHPELPEHSIPVEFYRRAYELAERQITFELNNAQRAANVDPAIRATNSTVISNLFEEAEGLLLSHADGDAATTAIKKAAATKRNGILFAAQDPFHGYERTLTNEEIAAIKSAMHAAAATVQVIRVDGASGASRLRSGAARPVSKESDIGKVLSALSLIPKSLVPERMEQAETGRALITDVQRWWKSVPPDRTAQFESIWKSRRDETRKKRTIRKGDPAEAGVRDANGNTHLNTPSTTSISEGGDSIHGSWTKWLVVAVFLFLGLVVLAVTMIRWRTAKPTT